MPEPTRAWNPKALAGPGAAIAGEKLTHIAMVHLNRQYENEADQFPQSYAEAWSVILGLLIGAFVAYWARDRDE